MELENDTFLRALRREQTEYTPIWLMRQAGRFLPEYRRVREQCGSFMALAKNPAAATEVTLQPVERFGLDAAILFSDILTVPDAMGLGLGFVAGEGPKFEHPVRTEEAVRKLFVPDPTEKLRYVMDAVTSIRHSLNGRVPLIGFAGSPYTLACYMVEGGSSRDFSYVKEMLYSRPELLEKVLDINVKAVAAYLAAQVESGAQALQIFDTWGGSLTEAAFKRFSLNPIRQVIERLRKTLGEKSVPIIVFTKGGGNWLEDLAQCGADCIGVDWTVNLEKARKRTRGAVALQGNMDPAVLLSTDAAIEKEAKRIVAEFGQVGAGAGHVFNLGHGVLQQTRPEAVKTLVEVVHSVSARYHVA
jgi:uroporphyrinogen decarboxylase